MGCSARMRPVLLVAGLAWMTTVGPAMAQHDMNMGGGTSAPVKPGAMPALRQTRDVFQTVAPAQPLRDVIGEARFERPVVTADSAEAWSGLERLAAQPSRRVWFCGAYAASGIPLLESAVRSARDVVDRITAAATQAGLRAESSV